MQHYYLTFSGQTIEHGPSYLTRFFFFTAAQFRVLPSRHANCRFCRPGKNCGFPLIYPASLTARAYVSSSCFRVNCGRTEKASSKRVGCCIVFCFVIRNMHGSPGTGASVPMPPRVPGCVAKTYVICWRNLQNGDRLETTHMRKKSPCKLLKLKQVECELNTQCVIILLLTFFV